MTPTDLIAQYRRDQERRGLRPRSISQLQGNIRTFIRWLDRDPMTATEEDIQRFLDARNISARTRYTWVSTLHGFYAWAVRYGHTPSDPTVRIIRPKLRRTLPRPINDADLAVALDMADSRMRAWLCLAAFAGLRCAEIAELTRDAVMEGQGIIRVLGKGATERIVPLHPLAWEAMRSAGLPRTGPVFRRANGLALDPAKVSRLIALYFDDLGIDATAHRLRHWFATRTYAACSDLRVVQELLGHASPSTTAVYTAFSTAVATDAVLALALV